MDEQAAGDVGVGRFTTIRMAAEEVLLTADDLRARLDAAEVVIVAGFELARRGNDLVELRRAGRA